VHTFHESVPTLYENRENALREYGEMHTAIAKLETAFDAFKDRQYGSRFEDMQRGYGMRYEDQGKRYEGDARTERGYRTQAQQMTTQALAWIISGGFVFFTTAVSIIIAVVLHR
jgi:hypothetical protein